jgi:hypothetical protein
MSVEFTGISSVDREHALAELRRAAEDGRLAPFELDERTERARNAVLLSELTALLADLATRGTQSTGALVARGPAGVVMAGYNPADPLVLSAGFSAARRVGHWVVPPFLRVQAGMDNVRINCLQARPAAEVIDLEILPGAGTVLLILPGGWAVNVDRLGKGIGAIKVKAASLPDQGCPIFVVRGSMGMGTFKARGASRRELRRLARGR